jgi:hypothetical protein
MPKQKYTLTSLSQIFNEAAEKEILRIQKVKPDFIDKPFDYQKDDWRNSLFLSSAKIAGYVFSKEFQQAIKNEKFRQEAGEEMRQSLIESAILQREPIFLRDIQSLRKNPLNMMSYNKY